MRAILRWGVRKTLKTRVLMKNGDPYHFKYLYLSSKIWTVYQNTINWKVSKLELNVIKFIYIYWWSIIENFLTLENKSGMTDLKREKMCCFIRPASHWKPLIISEMIEILKLFWFIHPLLLFVQLPLCKMDICLTSYRGRLWYHEVLQTIPSNTSYGNLVRIYHYHMRQLVFDRQNGTYNRCCTFRSCHCSGMNSSMGMPSNLIKENWLQFK